MNTVNDWKTTVTIQNPERAAFWNDAIGTATLPVRSFIPSQANLPGRPSSLIYLLDVAAISDEMKLAIAKGIARKFNATPQVVLDDMAINGMPILADDCIVSSADPKVLMSIVLD